METWYPLLSLICTAITSFAGVMISNKLVNYRLEQLEKKVEAHNNLVIRMTKVEATVDDLKSRVNDLEDSR